MKRSGNKDIEPDMGLPATIHAASIGIPDTMLLMLLALVVFGPRRLPEIGRQIGKLMYEFRKVSNDFKFQMEEELRAHEETERQKKLEEARTLEAKTAPALEASTPGVETAVASDTYATPEPVFTAGASAEPVADSTASASEELAVAEDRGEPRKFPPPPPRPAEALVIQPPTTGDPVEAARPFRGRIPEPESVLGSTSEAEIGIVTEAETTATQAAPQVESFSGGTHAGSGTEHETHHA